MGWLLGGVVGIAAFVFALTVGLILSCFVLASAWLFYRPFIGLLMLALVGLGSYFVFFFPMYD